MVVNNFHLNLENIESPVVEEKKDCLEVKFQCIKIYISNAVDHIGFFGLFFIFFWHHSLGGWDPRELTQVERGSPHRPYTRGKSVKPRELPLGRWVTSEFVSQLSNPLLS